jgi:hypothetical protein
VITLTSSHREFAQRAAHVARRLGIVTKPTLDEAKFRIVEGDVAIDLLNLWHLTGCRSDPDEDRLAALLAPRELGAAGYMGRIDLVHRMLTAGADPNAAEPDGVTPLGRTLAAWVTTDLHLAVVVALLDAGLVVRRSELDILFAEVVWNDIDLAIARLLHERAS